MSRNATKALILFREHCQLGNHLFKETVDRREELVCIQFVLDTANDKLEPWIKRKGRRGCTAALQGPWIGLTVKETQAAA